MQYHGPIIDRGIEQGIVNGNEALARAHHYVLAVEDYTGELVILCMRYPYFPRIDYVVSTFNPEMDTILNPPTWTEILRELT